MASNPEPSESVRQSDALAYMTSDSPSGFLVESEIAMLGRLGRGRTPRARLLGRMAAALLLTAFVLGIVLPALYIFTK